VSDWPALQLPPPPILTPFSPDSLGLVLANSGVSGMQVIASGTWPFANRAYFYPFTLPGFATVYQLLFWVGATSAGNIDVGIYDDEKNRLVSAGSTAMSATVNTWQELNVTDTPLPPGEYLLAAVASSSTGTFMRNTFTTDEAGLSAVPIYSQDTAGPPLPDPCAPVITTDATPPVAGIGIQLRSIF
jgi:hypothetical protein